MNSVKALTTQMAVLVLVFVFAFYLIVIVTKKSAVNA